MVDKPICNVLLINHDQSTLSVKGTHKVEIYVGIPTKLSHLAYSILLAQLIGTLIHYPFTMPLAGLDNWSALLEQVC